MRFSFCVLIVAVAATSLTLMACTQAASAPAPTPAAAAPTKAAASTSPAAAPTSAPAAPTAAPAKKVDFPAGKPITFIVPYSAGGATHSAALVLGSLMERELATSVQVVAKPGGGVQIGVTELSLSKPDGYTLGYTVFPTVITNYLDPEMKAPFSRKDFQPIAGQYTIPTVLSVQSSSPYKTLKDLIDAAKAKPGSLKIGTTGVNGNSHLAVLELLREGAIDLTVVHFDGEAPLMTALLGGHIDISINVVSQMLPPFRDGQVRPLAVLEKQGSKYLPDVRTAEAQGYRVYRSAIGGVSAPAGIPKEVVDVLSAAAQKAMSTSEHLTKMDNLGFTPQPMAAEQFAATWIEQEQQLKPLMELAVKARK